MSFSNHCSTWLDATIVKSIEAGEDAKSICEKFDLVYQGVNYPPVRVYKMLLLCSAVSLEHDALVSYLLETENGYNLNYSFGYITTSPLNVAVRIGREDYVRKLLDAGASVNEENSAFEKPMSEICSALELAMKLDNWNLAELMIPLYDREKTRIRRTPLHLACFHGSAKCVDHILNTKEGQSDVNCIDSDDPHCPEGYSPLMLGVHHGAWLVEKLLKIGGNAKHVTGRLRRNALHIACSQNTNNSYHVHKFVSRDLPQVIQLLVEAGCNVNDIDKHGDTPLSLLLTQISCELNAQKDIAYPYEIDIHREVVVDSAAVLLKMGADPDGNIRNVPLSVLTKQLDSILRPIKGTFQYFHDIHDIEIMNIFLSSAYHATCLVRDLLQLLIVNGANTKFPDAFGSVRDKKIAGLDIVLGIISENGVALSNDHIQLTNDIYSVLVDVFRLLLLSCDDSFEPSLVFYLFIRQIPCSELFLNMLVNFCGRNCFRIHMNHALNKHQVANETYLKKFEAFTQMEPDRLKNLTRATIIKCLGKRTLMDVANLKLPNLLKEYILSLE